ITVAMKPTTHAPDTSVVPLPTPTPAPPTALKTVAAAVATAYGSSAVASALSPTGGNKQTVPSRFLVAAACAPLDGSDGSLPRAQRVVAAACCAGSVAGRRQWCIRLCWDGAHVANRVCRCSGVERRHRTRRPDIVVGGSRTQRLPVLLRTHGARRRRHLVALS